MAHLSFQDWMAQMSLKDFIQFFVHVRNPSTGLIIKFEAWPKQEEFLDWLENLKDTGLLLKSRQAGGSTMAAALALKTAFSNGNIEVLILSKDEEASNYFLAKRVMEIYDNLPNIAGIVWPQITTQNLSRLAFSNGSKISSLPATAIGAAGVTAKLVVFDEVALVDLNAAARGGAKEVFATVRPTVQKAGGRILMLSTARPASYFNQLCQEILNGERDMPLFFFAATDDPTLTPAVFAKLKAEYSPIEFKREYPLTPEDAFLSNTGLVFKSFSKARHVREVHAERWWDTYVVMDFGYRDNTVALVCRYNHETDEAHIWKELVWKETAAEEIAKDLRVLKAKLPDKTEWIADAAIFSQTGHTQSIADIFGRCGITFRRSYKHRGLDPYDGSIAHLGARFTFNKISIDPGCVYFIWELMNYKWKEGGTRDVPEDKNNHACFVAGTQITMANGQQKAIEHIVAGEFVLTGEGPRRVTRAGSSGIREIYELSAPGHNLYGTVNHPIMTKDGFVALGELDANSYVYVQEGETCKTWSNTLDIDISEKKVEVTSNAQLLRTMAMLANTCTEKYGRMNMDQSQKDIKSITKTIIQPIIVPQTSSVVPHKSMLNAIHQLRLAKLGGRIWLRMLGQRLLHGISLKPELSGIRPRPRLRALELRHTVCASVKSVAKNIWPRTSQLNSAAIIAEPRPDADQAWIMRHADVGYVAKSLSATNTCQPPFALAPVVVTPLRIRREVFNLTVEGVPEYIANGVLVHNCDAARYLCAELSQRLRPKPEEPLKAYSAEKERIYRRLGEKNSRGKEAGNSKAWMGI